MKGSVYKTFFGQLTQSAIPAAAPKNAASEINAESQCKRTLQKQPTREKKHRPPRKKHIALLPKYGAIMPDSGKGGLPKKTHSKASGKSARNRQRKVPVIQPAIKNLQKNARDTNSNGFPGVGKARANLPRRRM